MHAPTSVDPRKQPVTTALGLAAVMATVWWWMGHDISLLLENVSIVRGQLWRPLTSCLLHVDAFHLVFNLFWLWFFGARLEETWGSVPTLAVYALLAYGSSAAEFGFASGGVGLSGIGYGLFGLFWVLHRNDERFAGAIDQQTIQLFIGWFFLCIVLTYTDVWRIGNIAHGAGAVLGVLLGWTVASRQNWRRVQCALGLAVSMAFVSAAATFARPYVNFSDTLSHDLAQLGLMELEDKDYDAALYWLRHATELAPQDASVWYNTGVVRSRLEDAESADDAFSQALALQPRDKLYRKTAADWKEYRASSAFYSGDFASAAKLYRDAIQIDSDNRTYWIGLAAALKQLGITDEADEAERQAASLAPNDESTKALTQLTDESGADAAKP